MGGGRSGGAGRTPQSSRAEPVTRRYGDMTPRNGRVQFLVLSYAALTGNQTDTLQRILAFLGLEPLSAPDTLRLQRWNPDPLKATPLRELDPARCAALAALYAGHMEALYALVNAPGTPPVQPAFRRFPDPCAPSNASAA